MTLFSTTNSHPTPHLSLVQHHPIPLFLFSYFSLFFPFPYFLSSNRSSLKYLLPIIFIMSTILQSCFESQLIETTTTVKLKFAPKTDPCGLSFQQVLATNICSNISKETIEKETVYVHPLSKRSSSSRLSEKSFEMCTENLGSETGTDDIMDSSIFSLSSSSINSPSSWEKSSSSSLISSPREYSRNKVTNSRNFPPPLSTISGANSLQVRPHREGGRLVIKAIESPEKHTYLRAERSNGRLRLSMLLKDHPQASEDFDSQENNEIDSEEKEDDINENYINDEDLEDVNQELEDDENEDDDESDAQMIMSNRDIDENFDIEVEMGMEKFQRLSRCSEGGHSNNTVLHKPLWVATS